MIGNTLAHRLLYTVVVLATLRVTLLGEPLAPQDSASTSETTVAVPGESLETMISDRREELTRHQKTLRETISRLGDNHPSVAGLREEAKQTMMQLEFWSSPPEDLLSLSGREMRALVLQLVVRVDRLESDQRKLQSTGPRGPQTTVPAGRGR